MVEKSEHRQLSQFPAAGIVCVWDIPEIVLQPSNSISKEKILFTVLHTLLIDKMAPSKTGKGANKSPNKIL